MHLRRVRDAAEEAVTEKATVAARPSSARSAAAAADSSAKPAPRNGVVAEAAASEWNAPSGNSSSVPILDNSASR
jgi:hypothetical protein